MEIDGKKWLKGKLFPKIFIIIDGRQFFLISALNSLEIFTIGTPSTPGLSSSVSLSNSVNELFELVGGGSRSSSLSL